MTYEEKKKIADDILSPMSWNELADTNSLHDVEPDGLTDQNIHDAIYDACNERLLNDSGFTLADIGK